VQKFDYARVSSVDQSLDHQIAALRAVGCDRIHIMERVHKRGAFIKVLDRPGLDLTHHQAAASSPCCPA
jgi:DNA invertase Pin-like site-specific DNA recombinase